jgi:predicted phage terminase large subunit-like protein
MGGGVRAVGVGAGITGYGGKLVIIDDPIKSRSEAESETYRNKTWEWFNDDLYTRLEPDASMILIQTRWHEDDLAGRLLQEMKNGGEHWEVVSLPAICEEVEKPAGTSPGSEPPAPLLPEEGWPKAGVVGAAGGFLNSPTAASPSRSAERLASPSAVTNKDKEALPPGDLHPASTPFIEIRDQESAFTTPSLLHSATPPLPRRWDAIGRIPGDPLCPERFSIRELERIRRQLGEYSFSALYQQRPMPLEGGLFKKKWFTRIIDIAPARLRWFRGYDLAISTKTSADYTASARVAIDNEGFLYISDVFRARVEYPEQRKFIIDRLRNERDTEHCIEDAIHAKAVIHDLRRDPSLARCAVRLVTVTNDKFTRALAWANRAEEGKVVLVRGPWLNMFLDEVCSFPNAAHDDQVDAVSIAVQNIHRRKRQCWGF